jgi:branched-chain amino acid transport system ATP-binding protein
MLEIKNLNSFYGEAHILFDVNLRINEGDIAALFGRNGVGKTTTFRSIMGLTPPRCEGEILYRAENIRGLEPHQIARRGIGFVPEDRQVFPNLTVRRNLIVGRKKRGNGPKKWDVDQVYEAFPKLKILEHHLGSHLSGGEQQMLTIARTLMGNPELLLVDEPTEGLSPLVADLVLNMIRVMQESGCAILLVEHAIDIALRFAFRVYIISKGLIVWGGTKEEFYAHDDIRKRYLEI